jgi:hypothetical protein
MMVAVTHACDAPRVEGPAIAPSFAKSGGGPSVTAASPASGHQGAVTLDVTISGSGFDNGSRAIWQLNGVPYSKVTVNSTRFNSSTSLTANITIAADAAVTTYDIAVLTSTGKKGIGAELFTVTYAIPLSGVTEGRAISDSGVVAGFNGSTVVVWSAATGAVAIEPNGMVWDIDRNGRAIGGRNAAGKAVLWTSATGLPGSWSPTTMPDLGNGGAVRGIASDAAGDALFLTGTAWSLDNNRHTAVWTRGVSGWQLRINAAVSGVSNVWGQAINGRGQVVGMDGSGCCTAVYFDSLGNPTRLTPVSGSTQAAAWGINGDGTIAVGNSGGLAVLWRRTLVNDVYGPWSAAIALENTASLCPRSGGSAAYDINVSGTVIVGSSCGVATAWKVAGGSVTARVVLQGLGPPNQSVAFGINDTAAPLATGSAKNTAGVYWWGF